MNKSACSLVLITLVKLFSKSTLDFSVIGISKAFLPVFLFDKIGANNISDYLFGDMSL